MKWYRAAAERGDPRGQLYLGQMYLFGYGVSEDAIEAHKWSNLAASKLTGEDELRARGNRSTAASEINRFVTSTQRLNEAQRLAAEWKPKTWEVIRQELKIGPPQ